MWTVPVSVYQTGGWSQVPAVLCWVVHVGMTLCAPSEPPIVTCAVAVADSCAPTPDLFLSVPLMLTVPCAGIGCEPGFGSSTSVSRPSASEQVRRCLPASSVVTVQTAGTPG